MTPFRSSGVSNTVAFFRRLRVIGVLAAITVLAAACASLPADSSWGSTSLFDSKILLAFSDHVVEVDPSNGLALKSHDASGTVRNDDTGKALDWLTQVNANNVTYHFYTHPVQTDDKTLIAAAYENKLFQIDLNSSVVADTTGITVPGNVVGDPLLTDKFLYVPLSNAGVVALDRSKLASPPVWTFDADGNKGVWAQPLVSADGSTLYVASMDHNLYALDAATGNQKWKAPVDLEGAVASTPVFNADKTALYVGSFGNKVFKISPDDGSIIAQYSTNNWVWGSPTVVGDMVYATDLSGYVYALQDTGSTLKEVWAQKVANGAIRMSPYVSGDTIVVGSADQNVYWLSAKDGSTTFSRPTQGQVLANILPIPASGSITEPIIIVSTIAPSQQLVAFTLTKGTSLWAYPSS